jgi:hypothetical protein
MRRNLILAALIAATACATSKVTPFSTRPAKETADEVEVFTDATPDRPYEEIGLIEVDQALATGYGDLVIRARQDAAQLGADAIIVTRAPKKTKELIETGRDKHGNRSTTVVEKEEPRILVRAIVWKGRGQNERSVP